MWRSASASAPPNSDNKISSKSGQSLALSGADLSAMLAMLRIGVIAGFSASAKAAESTEVGIPLCEKARVSAATSEPGLRTKTAIFDQGTPSRRCALRKA